VGPSDVERARPRTVAETAVACEIPRSTAELFLAADSIDLHTESFSFERVFGYDLRKRHKLGWNRALLFGQADLPRLLEVGLRGAVFSLTANPWLSPAQNLRNLPRLFARLKKTLEQGDRAGFVPGGAGFRPTQRAGKLAAFLAIQGATLLGDRGFPEVAKNLPLVSVGLLHLTRTHLGSPNAPSLPFTKRSARGLTRPAFELLEALGNERIFVDLAHLHPEGFWDAVRGTPSHQPLVVTHTGVAGVHAHWRNLDDAMLRAIADRGGVVGIIYHSYYLGDRLLRGRLDTLVRHFVHAGKVIGRDKLALGSDWDGLICTPRDMKTCLELPKLAAKLLEAGFSVAEVQGVFGGNFLRALGDLKGT
jgi:membrane dipeptidase